MEPNVLMYIVIGLLSIFFIVLLIFSIKTWRVLHLLSAFMVFVSALFLVWFSAAALKTNSNWRKAVERYNEKVATEEAKAVALVEGTRAEDDRPNIPKSQFDQIEYVDDSIRDVRAALERMLVDRGRVWRGCTPVVNNAGQPNVTVTLTVPATEAAAPEEEADPADGEAPADGTDPADGADPADGGDPPADPEPAVPAGDHGIEPNTIVFGFLEGPSELTGDLRGHTVPQLYLGEFRVIAETDTTITLQPTLRLSPLQAGSLAGGNWTVYDNMPVDSHYSFAGLSEEDLRILFKQERLSVDPDEYNVRLGELSRFFEGLPANELPNKIPLSRIAMNDAEYEEFIQSYLKNGQPIADADAQGRAWKRVSFNAPTSIQIDTVLETAAGDPTDENFEIRNAVARKRASGDIVIGEPALVVTKDDDVDLGTFRLAMTVADSLKLVSDYDLEVLWNNYEAGKLWNPDLPPNQQRTLKALSALDEDEAKQKAALETLLEAKSIEFDLGDTAIVDAATANFLTSTKIDGETGIADEVESVFVRPLRDYTTFFNDGYRQQLVFEDEAAVIQQDTVTLRGANTRALEQVTYRADEISKLQADRDGFQREMATMTGVLEVIEQRERAVRARLSQLFRTNVQLAERIHALQTQMADDAREAAATERSDDDLTPAVAASP